MDIFEYASRNKLRFPYKGNISTEDLWDLSVTDLDEVFKKLNAASKELKEESLLNVRPKGETDLTVKIDIVKRIVSVKLADAERAKNSAKNRAEKQRIMEIIADKKDDALKGKSLEELQKILAEME